MRAIRLVATSLTISAGLLPATGSCSSNCVSVSISEISCPFSTNFGLTAVLAFSSSTRNVTRLLWVIITLPGVRALLRSHSMMAARASAGWRTIVSESPRRASCGGGLCSSAVQRLSKVKILLLSLSSSSASDNASSASTSTVDSSSSGLVAPLASSRSALAFSASCLRSCAAAFVNDADSLPIVIAFFPDVTPILVMAPPTVVAAVSAASLFTALLALATGESARSEPSSAKAGSPPAPPLLKFSGLRGDCSRPMPTRATCCPRDLVLASVSSRSTVSSMIAAAASRTSSTGRLSDASPSGTSKLHCPSMSSLAVSLALSASSTAGEFSHITRSVTSVLWRTTSDSVWKMRRRIQSSAASASFAGTFDKLCSAS